MSRQREHSTRPAQSPERLWTPHEAAEYLGVPIKTLEKWRYIREGPAFFKVGRHVRYDPEAVRRWLVQDCQVSTAS